MEYDKRDEIEEEEQVEEVEETEDEELEELDFGDFFGSGDEDEEESEEEPEEPEEPGEEEKPVPEWVPEKGVYYDPTTGEEYIPQSKVNQIAGEARKSSRELAEHARLIEQKTGMPLRDVYQKMIDREAEELENETGLPPERARQIVDALYENEYMKKQVFDIMSRQKQYEQRLSYEKEKETYLHNPIIKQYEREIDEIAAHGEALPFSAAAKYFIGERFIGGELKDNMQSSVQRKMAATRKPQMRPEMGGGTGYAMPSIPKELRFFANKMGEDPKEVHQEYLKIEREKKRGF
jgi:hypothetical protein